MTNDEMRIAVAEEMGWYVKNKPWGDAVEWALYDPTGRCVASGHDRRPKNIPTYAAVFDCAYLPDFPADLNACAEMEEALPPAALEDYANALVGIVGRYWFDQGKAVIKWSEAAWRFATAHATAPQRCEAFLRARGKWVDGNNT